MISLKDKVQVIGETQIRTLYGIEFYSDRNENQYINHTENYIGQQRFTNRVPIEELIILKD